MSRYRKIEVRIWADDKFRALSPLPPSGQSLWLFLLTGPHTGPVPGLFRAGQMAMAEELDWEPEAFREAFQEVFREGMAKADWKARVVWIPKSIYHNLPQSPNVIKSWEEELKLIPECALKTEALQGIRAALEPLGASYLSVFDAITQTKPLAKPFRKPSAKPMANQEQEQQQEQEQEQEKRVSAQAPNPPTVPPVMSRAKRPRSASKTSLPEDFGITPELQAWADEKGYGDLPAHLESFKDKAQAKGYQYTDWAAAFRNAIRDDWARLRNIQSLTQPSQRNRPRGLPPQPSTDPRVAEFEAILQNLNARSVIEGECHVAH